MFVPAPCAGCAFYIPAQAACSRSVVGGSKTEVYHGLASAARRDPARCGPQAAYFVPLLQAHVPPPLPRELPSAR